MIGPSITSVNHVTLWLKTPSIHDAFSAISVIKGEKILWRGSLRNSVCYNKDA